mmetsp:Transcript_171017/g.548016  ORF Transcript_171017/g.548016 Transcript_171017/m.548016 type:complete len:201 (+) Transcript_171017:552-1154(+)
MSGDTNVQGGRHLSDVQLRLYPATLFWLRSILNVRLLLTLTEDVVRRIGIQTSPCELLSDVNARKAAIILVDVALVARGASQVGRRMRCPDPRDAHARLLQVLVPLAEVCQAVAHPFPDDAAALREPGLEDLRAGVQDVGLLGVHEVQGECRTRCLVEGDVQRHVKVLLILALVNHHLVLRLLLEEVPKLHEEEGRDQDE